MKKLHIRILSLLLAIAVLGIAACSDDSLPPKKQQSEDRVSNEQADKGVNYLVIKDEQKEIEVTKPVVFDAENNALLSIPTHIGGNIELVVDGVPYVVCYGYGGELVLEKDGCVYGLNGLTDIVETATGLSLDALCAYTAVKDEQAYTVMGWDRRRVFDILSVVFDSAPLADADTTGEYLRFTNKLGANFDLYTEQSVIYSYYLDAYYDVSAYQSELGEVSSLT